jgi:hypothetical protein
MMIEAADTKRENTAMIVANQNFWFSCLRSARIEAMRGKLTQS